MLFDGRRKPHEGAVLSNVLNNLHMCSLESWAALQSFISTDKVAGVLKINRDVAGVTESLSCMQQKAIRGK